MSNRPVNKLNFHRVNTVKFFFFYFHPKKEEERKEMFPYYKSNVSTLGKRITARQGEWWSQLLFWNVWFFWAVVLFCLFLFAFYFYFEMRGVTMAWNPWYPLVTPVSGSNVGRGWSGTASNWNALTNAAVKRKKLFRANGSPKHCRLPAQSF